MFGASYFGQPYPGFTPSAGATVANLGDVIVATTLSLMAARLAGSALPARAAASALAARAATSVIDRDAASLMPARLVEKL